VLVCSIALFNVKMVVLLRFSRLLLLAGAFTVNAEPLSLSKLWRRGTLPHDQVKGFAEAVPAGTVGDVYEAYQPYLDVVNGCVPFPAVDADGNTSQGLATSGSSNGGCSSNLGQVYSRGVAANGRYALMYSWYMPKDSPSDGLGHRHEWEGVIIWLSSATATTAANILAVCPSAHGKWDCSTTFKTDSNARAPGPYIMYMSVWPVNHQMWIGTSKGGQQPLIAWESLTSAARTALENTDFGSATVPFKDATFAGNVAAATF